MTKEIEFHVLKKRSLFIATPMYDGLCTQGYTQSTVALTRILTNIGIPFEFHALGNESLIQRARNYNADDFMRSGCSHMLFIDADIEFDPMAVLDLLATADPQSDKHILCGPYPKKAITFEKLVDAIENKRVKNADDLDDFIGDFVFNMTKEEVTVDLGRPFEISEGGTGFMMIQRSAFERFADAYPELYYRPDHKREKDFDGSRKIMAYFDCEIDRGTFNATIVRTLQEIVEGVPGAHEKAEKIVARFAKSSERYLSEDYQFCRMARDIGLKVWLLPWIRLAHHGRYAFRGNLVKMLQSGMSPTFHKATRTVVHEQPTEPTVAVPF